MWSYKNTEYSDSDVSIKIYVVEPFEASARVCHPENSFQSKAFLPVQTRATSMQNKNLLSNIHYKIIFVAFYLFIYLFICERIKKTISFASSNVKPT